MPAALLRTFSRSLAGLGVAAALTLAFARPASAQG
jgi:hypothetical protein